MHSEAAEGTEAPRVCVCPETGSGEPEAVATLFLENNSRVWWHLHNPFFFFFFFFKSMTSSGPLGTVQKTSLHPNLCENSQHTARHKSRTEHTHEAGTHNKPLTCAKRLGHKLAFHTGRSRSGSPEVM